MKKYIFLILILFLSVSIQAKMKWGYQHDADSDTVGLWHFNRGEGTTAYDTALNNNGTITGAIWCNGFFDKCLDFDGDGDYVEVPHNVDFNIGSFDAYTILIWVYPESNTNYQVIIDKGYNFSVGWRIYYDYNDNRFGVYYCTSQMASQSNYPINNWYNIVFVFSNIVEDKIYINGELDGIKDIGVPGDTEYPLRIGYYTNYVGGWTYFNGKVEETVLLNRALSVAEIKHIYQSQSGKYQ